MKILLWWGGAGMNDSREVKRKVGFHRRIITHPVVLFTAFRTEPYVPSPRLFRTL